MAWGLNVLKLSFLFSLLSSSNFGLWPNKGYVSKFPPTCNRIECPEFEVVHAGQGFEIRKFNDSVWMSTEVIQDISLVGATRTGFLKLFDYIQGENLDHKKIEMTAPVITEVSPGAGPICESSFTVSFYVPKINQADPPPARGLHVQRWHTTYAAVRQFGGFVSDYNVGEEAAELKASLDDSDWSFVVEKGHGGVSSSAYVVAQYNAPFTYKGRVNEIWLLFDMG